MSINFKKKILFRADASTSLGIGHIMRCLTIAEELKSNGAECAFICREQKGDATELILNHGFYVYVLPPITNTSKNIFFFDEIQDAQDSIIHIEEWRPDLIIVDHYNLSCKWETIIKKRCQILMVIDDLANRCHDCSILVDQGMSRNNKDYDQLVSDQCILLTGQYYSILRQEFGQLRAYSLKRRNNFMIDHLLITMGGSDEPNATGKVLHALTRSALPKSCLISIIMGSRTPWLDTIKQQVKELPWNIKILVDVKDMAAVMSASDLAIGAVGGTAWERCCLGLPTLMVIIADNQMTGAYALEESGAGKLIGTPEQIDNILPAAINQLLSNPHLLSDMSVNARKITNGHGVRNIITEIGKIL